MQIADSGASSPGPLAFILCASTQRSAARRGGGSGTRTPDVRDTVSLEHELGGPALGRFDAVVLGSAELDRSAEERCVRLPLQRASVDAAQAPAQSREPSAAGEAANALASHDSQAF